MLISVSERLSSSEVVERTEVDQVGIGDSRMAQVDDGRDSHVEEAVSDVLLEPVLRIIDEDHVPAKLDKGGGRALLSPIGGSEHIINHGEGHRDKGDGPEAGSQAEPEAA